MSDFLKRFLLDDPPKETPTAWKFQRYLVDRTRNLYWTWTAMHDGLFPSSSITGPSHWPASGQCPEWIDPRDILAITTRCGQILYS